MPRLRIFSRTLLLMYVRSIRGLNVHQQYILCTYTS